MYVTVLLMNLTKLSSLTNLRKLINFFPTYMSSVVLILITWLTSMLYQKQLVHYRYFLPAPLVLRSAFIYFLSFMVDRNRTASRRSKPNSRTALIGEQPNPWNLLQLQDAMSRHRGAKLPHR